MKIPSFFQHHGLVFLVTSPIQEPSENLPRVTLLEQKAPLWLAYGEGYEIRDLQRRRYSFGIRDHA